MAAGASAFVVLANLLDAPPALATGLLMAYLLGASLIIANYCVKHEDEIPTRAQRRHARRR
jgi:hypothetical protein